MEIFQVLVVLAVIAVTAWQKSREKKVKCMQTFKQQSTEEPDTPLSPLSLDAEIGAKKKREISRPVRDKLPSPSIESAVHNKQSSSVKLSTLEEARRAFIYSEIFSRKYK